MDDKTPVAEPVLKKDSKRPFVLSILCMFSFVYFGIISLLFFLSLIYSGWITEVVNKYMEDKDYTTVQVVGIALAGFLLHGFSFAGCIRMWYMKRSGYLIFGISTLIIAVYQLFQDQIHVLETVIYIGLIILFGLFYRKLH